jgi:hypothetical protein
MFEVKICLRYRKSAAIKQAGLMKKSRLDPACTKNSNRQYCVIRLGGMVLRGRTCAQEHQMPSENFYPNVKGI